MYAEYAMRIWDFVYGWETMVDRESLYKTEIL